MKNQTYVKIYCGESMALSHTLTYVILMLPPCKVSYFLA